MLSRKRGHRATTTHYYDDSFLTLSPRHTLASCTTELGILESTSIILCCIYAEWRLLYVGKNSNASYVGSFTLFKCTPRRELKEESVILVILDAEVFSTISDLGTNVGRID